ncbi:MAG: ACP S-malonyltransferase [Sphingomonadales bacterium]
MKPAFTFPGQGSQAVGMGKAMADAFPAARLVFEEVDDALSEHLSRLIFEGPRDQLTLTENTQPALMAVSIAVVSVLEAESGKSVADMASLVAGHSLGEYSALTAAGALKLSDTARLLRLRGRAMQRAAPVGEGAMAALLGLDLEAARAIADEAAEGEICACANDNAPGQIVVSGHRPAVDRATELARDKGARKAVLLPVSAPFHCALMAPAAREMEQALAEVEIASPCVPLVANVTAQPVENGESISRLLVEQVTGMVRWRESVEAMAAEGVASVVELGAGKVLTGLARRINRDLTGLSIQTPDDIDAFLKTL